MILNNPFKKYLKHLWGDKDPINKEMILKMISSDKGASILDIGCNDGSFTQKIKDIIQTNNVYGMELSKEFAEIAKKKHGINVVIASADKTFPFKDESFDIIISNQVIEHLCDTDSYIYEIHRTLKKDGTCIVSTGNLSSLHNIISLILGFQPAGSHVSDFYICGNPLNPQNNQILKPPLYKQHRRIFTAPALESIFRFYGFNHIKVKGWGLHPLPLFIQKRIRITKYSVYITLIAKKEV
ncbi:MAG: class I SAM-dependent methyltransferase [bacterium]|nr:class I SAM-dependent methyltransferase [bacterium]